MPRQLSAVAALLLAATACTSNSAAVSSDPPTPKATPVTLRLITGEQLCAAVPNGLRKSLVAGDHVRADWDHLRHSDTTGKASCAWGTGKMDLGDGRAGSRTLSVKVDTTSPLLKGGTAQAKSWFDHDRQEHEQQSPTRDLKYGDAAYGQVQLDTNGRHATVHALQGLWKITVTYGGTNEAADGVAAEVVPAEKEVLNGASQVAALIASEMAKDPAAVTRTDPCASLSHAEIAHTLQHAVGGEFTRGLGTGFERRTQCTWLLDPGHDGEVTLTVEEFPRDPAGAKKRLKSSVEWYKRQGDRPYGHGGPKTYYSARKPLPALGEHAFVVTSISRDQKTTNADEPREVLVYALDGNRFVHLRYYYNYQPDLDPSTATSAAIRLATLFRSARK